MLVFTSVATLRRHVLGQILSGPFWMSYLMTVQTYVGQTVFKNLLSASQEQLNIQYPDI